MSIYDFGSLAQLLVAIRHYALAIVQPIGYGNTVSLGGSYVHCGAVGGAVFVYRPYKQSAVGTTLDACYGEGGFLAGLLAG